MTTTLDATTATAEPGLLPCWAIVELMGHRRLSGRLSEVELGGASFLRVDVCARDDQPDPTATQIYSAGAVYCITPCDEDTARAAARINQVAPVTRWEIAPRPAPTPMEHPLDGEVDEDLDDDEPPL